MDQSPADRANATPWPQVGYIEANECRMKDALDRQFRMRIPRMSRSTTTRCLPGATVVLGAPSSSSASTHRQRPDPLQNATIPSSSKAQAQPPTPRTQTLDLRMLRSSLPSEIWLHILKHVLVSSTPLKILAIPAEPPEIYSQLRQDLRRSSLLSPSQTQDHGALLLPRDLAALKIFDSGYEEGCEIIDGLAKTVCVRMNPAVRDFLALERTAKRDMGDVRKVFYMNNVFEFTWGAGVMGDWLEGLYGLWVKGTRGKFERVRRVRFWVPRVSPEKRNVWQECLCGMREWVRVMGRLVDVTTGGRREERTKDRKWVLVLAMDEVEAENEEENEEENEFKNEFGDEFEDDEGNREKESGEPLKWLVDIMDRDGVELQLRTRKMPDTGAQRCGGIACEWRWEDQPRWMLPDLDSNQCCVSVGSLSVDGNIASASSFANPHDYAPHAFTKTFIDNLNAYSSQSTDHPPKIRQFTVPAVLEPQQTRQLALEPSTPSHPQSHARMLENMFQRSGSESSRQQSIRRQSAESRQNLERTICEMYKEWDEHAGIERENNEKIQTARESQQTRLDGEI